MRTFRILLTGWILGGAVIVLLWIAAPPVAALDVTSRARSRSAVGQTLPSIPSATGPSVGTGWTGAGAGQTGAFPEQAEVSVPHLLIPVVGIQPSDLRDTYTQARGLTRTHHAIDILAPRGTPVIAAVDGTIRKLFSSGSGGITIYEFDREERILYYYAHLDRYADNLREGDAVRQGTVLGYVGTTGNAPPGTPHLHFSIEVLPPTKEWWKGEPVNPYPLLRGADATTSVSDPLQSPSTAAPVSGR